MKSGFVCASVPLWLIYTLSVDAEIIAIGSELLTPFRQDTNSLYLTEQLNQLGVEVAFKTVVGDRRGHLVRVAKTALGRADLIIFMGGLGPTEDDLTREAVAAALGLRLRRDPELVAALYARFAALRRPMPENNERQCDVIAGAAVLPNEKGTAPGQWIEGNYENNKKIILLLPGPPWELKAMFEKQVLERLRGMLPPASIAARIIKVAMMPESACDARVAPIYKKYPDVETTILADAGEIQLHLRSRQHSPALARQRADALADELQDELGDSVFSADGESLEQIVAYYLEMRRATIAVAESCTGGLIAERLTSISGSSRYFLGGAVVYSNELKTAMADVPPLLIEQHGAVSRQVAAAMAEGIRRRSNSTVGVGVTGVAGPTGGTEDKPVGLVFHAIADNLETDVVERHFPGDRELVRRWAMRQALDLVRRKLM
ncbi:MAG TPA: competence/damage-inducible protein A [Terriglobales bacterium]|nr:competence/damage-inducible protein A [Terriglobales bacterium]